METRAEVNCPELSRTTFGIRQAGKSDNITHTTHDLRYVNHWQKSTVRR